MQTTPAVLAVASGLALGLGLIVAIGAQNAFVLRQGLRLEHVAAVVAPLDGRSALVPCCRTRPVPVPASP